MAQRDWHENLKFRCTGCGNCCRGVVVCLTDGDLERIVEGTGKAPAEFVCFYGEDDFTMEKHSPLWVRLGKRKVAMGLRSVQNHCVFLDQDNRCTIYEHRPVTCRGHPFKTTLSETGAVIRVGLRRMVKCLYELDGRVTKRSLRAVKIWNQLQEKEYVSKVREWNRRPGRKTRPGFLRFLGF